MINQDIVAAPEIQAGSNKAQAERGRADQGNFLRLAVQQFCADIACVLEAVQNKGFLIAEHAFTSAVVHRLRDATWQRTDGSMRKENFIFGNGKFMLAQFLVRQNLCKGHKGLRSRHSARY